MEDFSLPGKETVDRLPILVSGDNVVKLLAIPKLRSGTASVMATAILETVDEWGVRDRVSGLCFDTTTSNTGHKGGVCVILEKEIGRHLLHLACWHHVAEIALEKVFGMFETSASPSIDMFRDYWPRICQNSFTTSVQNEKLGPLVEGWKEEVILFCKTAPAATTEG